MLASDSLSMQSKNPLPTLFRVTPTFFHWFTISLYNVYLSAQQQYERNTDDIQLQVDDKDYIIKRSQLESTVRAIKVAVNLSCSCDTSFGFYSSDSICKQELTMSCLVARELDRLIFKDELFRNGACLHQAPVRKRDNVQGNPEASDVYIFSFSDS